VFINLVAFASCRIIITLFYNRLWCLHSSVANVAASKYVFLLGTVFL